MGENVSLHEVNLCVQHLKSWVVNLTLDSQSQFLSLLLYYLILRLFHRHKNLNFFIIYAGLWLLRIGWLFGLGVFGQSDLIFPVNLLAFFEPNLLSFADHLFDLLIRVPLSLLDQISLRLNVNLLRRANKLMENLNHVSLVSA